MESIWKKTAELPGVSYIDKRYPNESTDHWRGDGGHSVRLFFAAVRGWITVC